MLEWGICCLAHGKHNITTVSTENKLLSREITSSHPNREPVHEKGASTGVLQPRRQGCTQGIQRYIRLDVEDEYGLTENSSM